MDILYHRTNDGSLDNTGSVGKKGIVKYIQYLPNDSKWVTLNFWMEYPHLDPQQQQQNKILPKWLLTQH